MNHLIEIIGKFPGKKVGIIGDLMLDRYLICDVTRISPEAPVPVAKIIEEKFVLGGAANVAANVKSLGGKVEVLGLVGTDAGGERMSKLFDGQGIGSSLLEAQGRPTTVKTRLISMNQQIVRVDKESSENISAYEEKEILKRLPAFLEKNEIIIISDYAKGLMTENLTRQIISLAQKRGIKVLSDPKTTKFEKFKNSYIVKPNKEQAELMSGTKLEKDYSNLLEMMRVLAKKMCSILVVTLGKDGLAIHEKGGIERISSTAAAGEVYDVSGAGDAVISGLALAIASGADLKEAALIGNYLAGIAVSKIGTATSSASELTGLIKQKEL